jgi:hypothetical protein
MVGGPAAGGKGGDGGAAAQGRWRMASSYRAGVRRSSVFSFRSRRRILLLHLVGLRPVRARLGAGRGGPGPKVDVDQVGVVAIEGGVGNIAALLSGLDLRFHTQALARITEVRPKT